MQTQLLQRKMGPKKGRRVRNIEVSTDTPTAFEFEIQWQIYSRGGKRGGKKKGGRGTETEGGRTTRNCLTRPINILRTRPGRKIFGRASPTVASSLSECARLGLNLKGLLRQTHAIQVWSGSNRNDRKAEQTHQLFRL